MNLLDQISLIKPKADFHNYFYISLRHRYVYLAIGKAANSTVKHLLYALEYSGTKFKTKTVHERQSAPLLSAFQLPDELLDEVFTSDKYFRFSVVRNPYSRILSCYLDRILPGKSAPYRQLLRLLGKADGYKPTFDEFVRAVCEQTPFEQNNHWRLQTAELCIPVVSYDFIGKQESFASDMSQIWARIAPKLPAPDFARTNKAPSVTGARTRLDEFYTPELATLIQRAYEPDFQTFGYSSDLYPTRNQEGAVADRAPLEMPTLK